MSTINALSALLLGLGVVFTALKPARAGAVAYPLDEGESLRAYDITEGGNMPRGIRNNNPGNIRYTGTAWQGLDNPPSDGEYCRFIAPRWGIRAMARVLASYRARGVVTIRQIISTWAPVGDSNPTESYIYSVSQRMGIASDVPLMETDWPALIEAIIYHENGQQPYTMALIREGVSWA